MFYLDIPLATFSVSEKAKRGIEIVREAFNKQSSDPADVLCVGWGRVTPTSGTRSERVVVSFYGRSQRLDIAKGIQKVSGLEVMFYASVSNLPKFDGQLLDFDDRQGFFLRRP